MDRRTERETVFKMLFESEFKKEEDPSLIFDEVVAAAESDLSDYARTVYFGVRSRSDEIDPIISSHSKDWKISRISKVSLCVMRLSIFEMKEVSSDIPYAVSINEAVELAKKYDDPAAAKFINGILNSVAEEFGLK